MKLTDKYIIFLAISILLKTNFVFGTNLNEPNFADFYQALETTTDMQPAEIGQYIFNRLEQKYRNNTGFETLKSKMLAAEFLATQMITTLNKATDRQLLNTTTELLNANNKKKGNTILVPPAKSFYEDFL